MKLLLCILLVTGFSNAIFADKIKVPFTGDKIIIIGELQGLSINGGEDNIIHIQGEGKLEQDKIVDYVIDGSIFKVAINSKSKINLTIPKTALVQCNPLPIVYEGLFDHSTDYRNIKIQNLDSEIELNADGYHISFEDLSGPISIVTYGNITGKISHPIDNRMVLLDTYLGNVDLVLPSNGKGNLECTALQGKINISENLAKNYNADLTADTKIIVNTENGSLIKVRSEQEYSTDPTHPELRDEFIKIFIEDQGKNSMDNNSRKELEAMGYGEIIEAQPDIHKWHLVKDRHREYLDEVVEKHGFPTKEMIGDDYAIKAVRLIIMQSPKEYKLKYKEEFINAFGQKWFDIMFNIK